MNVLSESDLVKSMDIANVNFIWQESGASRSDYYYATLILLKLY